MVDVCREFTNLHANYTDTIVKFAKNSVKTGAPLNAPIWWIAPEDPNAFKINDRKYYV